MTKFKSILSDAEIGHLADEYLDTNHCTDKEKVGICGIHSFAQAVIEAYKVKLVEQESKTRVGEITGSLGWITREARHDDGSLRDCWVEAPSETMPYGCEVLGDDYNGFGDIEAKHEHCKMIVAWANNIPFEPEGWQLVPKDITVRMERAIKNDAQTDGFGRLSNPKKVYDAALAEAPRHKRK